MFLSCASGLSAIMPPVGPATNVGDAGNASINFSLAYDMPAGQDIARRMGLSQLVGNHGVYLIHEGANIGKRGSRVSSSRKSWVPPFRVTRLVHSW